MIPAGTIAGPSHAYGGVKFRLNTGQVIEAEGKEVVIPQELLQSKKVYSFRGSNKNILHRILKLSGLSAFDKVQDIRYGDVIICVRSAEDRTIRIATGTIEQILNEINISNGCNKIVDNGKWLMVNGGNTSTINHQQSTMRVSLKQRIKDWQTENPNSPRWQKKKERIQQLSGSIQRLRMNVSKDISRWLSLSKLEDEKQGLTALVIAVMLNTAERVGNDDSADNGHFGVTGFQKKHISVVGSKIHLDYVGKSGTKHEKNFSDERIAKALNKAIKNSPSKFIFETSDGFRIKADKVNRYLEQYDITAKDMRGYLANRWIIEELKSYKLESLKINELSNLPTLQLSNLEKQRKKIFNEVLKQVALRVGHGRGTLKKHYMIPELPNEWIEHGRIIDMQNLGYYREGGKAGEKIKSNFVNTNIMKKLNYKIEMKSIIDDTFIDVYTTTDMQRKHVIEMFQDIKEKGKTKYKISSSEIKEKGGTAGEESEALQTGNEGMAGEGELEHLTSAPNGKKECACFNDYLAKNHPELCEKIAEENINENAELRAQMDEAHNSYQIENVN